MGLLFTPVLLELHKSAVRTAEAEAEAGQRFNNLTLNQSNNDLSDSSSIYLVYIAAFVFFSMVITCAVWGVSLRNPDLGDDDWAPQTCPRTQAALSSTPLRLSRRLSQNYFTAPVAEEATEEEARRSSISTRARPLGGRTSFPVPVACAFNGMSPVSPTSALPHAAPVARGVASGGWWARRGAYP